MTTTHVGIVTGFFTESYRKWPHAQSDNVRKDIVLAISVSVLVAPAYDPLPPEYLFAFCIDVVLGNRTGTERLHVPCEIETIEDGKAKYGTPQASCIRCRGSCRDGSPRNRRPTFPTSIASSRFTGFTQVSSNVPLCCLRMKRSTLTEMKRDGTTAQRGRGEDDRRPLLECLPSH